MLYICRRGEKHRGPGTCPKPHSHSVVLRSPAGDAMCLPIHASRYTFGSAGHGAVLCAPLIAPGENGASDTRKSAEEGFPGGSVGKNLPPNAGDAGSTPDPGRSHVRPRGEALRRTYGRACALEPVLRDSRAAPLRKAQTQHRRPSTAPNE